MTASQKLTATQLARGVLLFFGAFMFAFILNSYVIHEAGHAFGGMLFGCKIRGLQINPFGTGDWVSECPSPVAMGSTGQFLQGMGGPIFGLPISIAITFLLWRKRTPEFLPLLMSAPVACVGNFLGVLDSMSNYPGHIFDYGLLLSNGVSPFVVRMIGFASLAIGIILMNILIPLAGAGMTEPFWKVLLLNLATWPLYLLIRLFYQDYAGKDITGAAIFFFLGIFLAIFTALTFRLTIKAASRFTKTEPVMPSARAVWVAFGSGLGLAIVLAVSFPV